MQNEKQACEKFAADLNAHVSQVEAETGRIKTEADRVLTELHEQLHKCQIHLEQEPGYI